jgi:ribosomal protein S18 acetylase RimI-like enzyme
MQVRPAESADISAIGDLVQRAYGPYIERIGRRPGPMDDDYAKRIRLGYAFVAEDGGTLVGLIVLIPRTDHMLVENVAVDPDRQGEGIGRTLLSFAETSAREAGISTLRLYTHAKMTENLALYDHLGYEEVERRAERGFERVFLSKSIR